jgi:hypothetical protein
LRLWRVHDATHAGEVANPHPGLTRWAPLYDVGGMPLPSMYVATSPVAAIAESVLHDVGFGEPHPFVLARRFALLALTELALQHGLTLLDFTGLGLLRIRAEPNDALYGGPSTYAATRAFAAKLLAPTRWVDGILYPSRKFPGGHCAVLYERRGRVAPSFDIVQTTALGVGPGRALVDRVCADSDVTVVV